MGVWCLGWLWGLGAVHATTHTTQLTYHAFFLLNRNRKNRCPSTTAYLTIHSMCGWMVRVLASGGVCWRVCACERAWPDPTLVLNLRVYCMYIHHSMPPPPLTPSQIRTHPNQKHTQIDSFGSEEQRQRWLPQMATLDLFSSYCLTCVRMCACARGVWPLL